jgi:catechol 2,3-dioxygenase-like lactoylglutathione lyase family enzyme
VINAAHTIIYTEDADATRAFFRDILEFPYVDAHGGWLIFKLPPAELGIHPTGDAGMAAQLPPGHHEIYFMCDDIEETVKELTAKGVEFTSPINDQGFGFVSTFNVPGAAEMGLYQPQHLTGYDLPG